MFPDILQQAMGYEWKVSTFRAFLRRIKRIFIPSLRAKRGNLSGVVACHGALLKGYTRRQVKRADYPAIFPDEYMLSRSRRVGCGNLGGGLTSSHAPYRHSREGGNLEGSGGGECHAEFISVSQESRPDLSLREAEATKQFQNVTNIVEGILYKNIPPEAWEHLDDFEGYMYSLQTVQVELPDGTIIPAQTYVIRREYMHLLEDFDWDYDNFLHHHITRFERVYEGYM